MTTQLILTPGSVLGEDGQIHVSTSVVGFTNLDRQGR